MLYRSGQIFGPTIKQYVLVHLVISRESAVVDFDLFISTAAMPEQAQVPTRKITAMVYPAAQKPEPPVQIKPLHIGAANRFSDVAFSLRCDAFVGIDDQNSFILPRNIFQSPVLLSSEIFGRIQLH